ncbi:MAG TPA: DegT/DnrJ/EryC1/StrS family aminotransferase [Thermoanaerobaculales bacterium]|nr:DegT/DnrJ/EryC1/StrS family aminotransferase [Thermoanaerobaculales bacterium]
MTTTRSTVTKMVLPSDQDASGRTLGQDELDLLAQAIAAGKLFAPKGRFVHELEARFAEMLGASRAYACTSGSAAVHTAIAAINPEPGDEIVTTSVTDMGALTPILYQGAIPVFADVDPITCNVTARTIEERLSGRTKAIIVTHLFGSPCDMTSIMALADSRGIPVIEDSAQALMAEHRGRKVGSFGSVGCFSLQQGKHITTGEGGLVVSNDPEIARRLFLYINKAWGYGDEKPDHYFLALNYRMNEITGAVAVAQLAKLREVAERRIASAGQLTTMLEGVPGITTPPVPDGDVHTFWKYCLNVDPDIIQGGSPALGGALKEFDIASAPRYIQKPSFMCQIFREQRTFGESRWPFTLARPEAVDYDPTKFPGTMRGLERILVLPWNEKYTTEHVRYIADAVHSSVTKLAR